MEVTPKCLSLKCRIFDTFWLVEGQLLPAIDEVFLVQEGYYEKWVILENTGDI